MSAAAPGSTFDPGAVPVQDAATVLLLDDRPDLHVLCLRRRAGSAFVGGMTVFPGGGIDAHDAEPAYATRVRGLTSDDAGRRLQTEGAFAYWIAVARETFEEVGVLLARHRDGSPAPSGVARHRHAVDDGTVTLLDVLDAEDLVLHLDEVYDVGRWITPVGPPRRYDTRFFVAHMPAGQVPVVDAVEAVHAEWRRPADALADHGRGLLTMLPPTVCLLQALTAFGDAGSVIAAAAQAHGPGRQARVRIDDGSFLVMLPGDEHYDDPRSHDVLGWVYEL